MRKSAIESLRSPEYDLLLKMLREARVAAAVGQRELSRQLSRSATYVYKIEAGSRRLDLVELFEILKRIDRDPTDFLAKYIAALSTD